MRLCPEKLKPLHPCHQGHGGGGGAAIAALLVGVVILFRPELWALLWGIVSHPAALGLLALSLAVAAGFVFSGPAWVAERWDALRRRRLDRGRREK